MNMENETKNVIDRRERYRELQTILLMDKTQVVRQSGEVGCILSKQKQNR
jgi:hypothetical protein